VRDSTIGLVNSSGSLATQFSYEPFGAVTASGSASTYPYLFAGMEYDEGTGLYHTPARYYSPRLQRFLSEDPLGLGGGDVNLLAYVANDPVNATDPSGLQVMPPGGFITAGGSIDGLNGIPDINSTFGFSGPGGRNGDGPSNTNGPNSNPSFSSNPPDVPPGVGTLSEYGSPPGPATSSGTIALSGLGGRGAGAAGGLGHIRSTAKYSSQIGIDSSQIVLSQASENNSPELRRLTPAKGSVGFGLCVGTFVAFSAPAAVGCYKFGLECASGALPACVPMAGACGYEPAGIVSCYKQSQGKSFPDLGEPPPGGISDSFIW